MLGVRNAFRDVAKSVREMQQENYQLKAENAKLREVIESCVVLMTDHQFLHLPELWDETLKVMRELGMEV